MSIVNDPLDDDEQYEMDDAYEFEEDHPQLTATVYLLVLLGGGLAMALSPTATLAAVLVLLIGVPVIATVFSSLQP